MWKSAAAGELERRVRHIWINIQACLSPTRAYNCLELFEKTSRTKRSSFPLSFLLKYDEGNPSLTLHTLSKISDASVKI